MIQGLGIVGPGRHLLLEFYEDKLKSKHLAKHWVLVFVFFLLETNFLFCFLIFLGFGTLEDGPPCRTRL